MRDTLAKGDEGRTKSGIRFFDVLSSDFREFESTKSKFYFLSISSHKPKAKSP